MRSRPSIASPLARGLVAGLAGTAAMTVLQAVDQRLSKLSSSKAPAEAAEKVLRVAPKTERGEELLGQGVHWAYGTAWGLGRALLPRLGLRGPLADAAHLGAVWGTSLVLLPAMRLAPPITRWSTREIARDLLYHGVYSATTGAVFKRLGPRPRRLYQRVLDRLGDRLLPRRSH